MSVTRMGATKKYSDNWENIFGRGKARSASKSPSKPARQSAKKKSAKKSAAKSTGRKKKSR